MLHRSADWRWDNRVKQAIANKLIDLAKAGERPDILCEQAFKDIRGQQV